MKPGVYLGLTMPQYLAIPALSASVIRTLLDRCAAAARHESWLTPQRVADDSDASDTGSVAHAILLEGSEACCQVLDPADYPNVTGSGAATGWTNKAIREARDRCRAAGKIPMLAGDMNEVSAMHGVARTFIDSLQASEPAIYRAFQRDGGRSEVTVIWEEGDTLCKLRADRISADNAVIVDYKTSGMSVEPDRWGRTQLVSMGYYVGASWYRRGMRAVTGIDPSYVFLCQETEAPYLCSLVGLDPAGMELGDEKVGAGLREWQKCVRDEHWPGYPNRVCYPEIPVWERMRWDERNGIGADGIPYDISKLFQKKESA